MNLGANHKSVDCADLPVEFPQALAPGPFTSKTLNSHIVSLVERLNALLLFHCVGVVTFGWVPYREGHYFIRGLSQLLNPKIPAVPSTGHEIGTVYRIFHNRLVIEQQ